MLFKCFARVVFPEEVAPPIPISITRSLRSGDDALILAVVCSVIVVRKRLFEGSHNSNLENLHQERRC